MSEGIKLAHEVNELMRANRRHEAYRLSERATQALLNGESSLSDFRVQCVAMKELKIGSRRSHVEIELQDSCRLVSIPEDIVLASFTNWVDAFGVIRSLFLHPALSQAKTGRVLFDIEDGSAGGDYSRAAFCAISAVATLVIDSYFNKYRGYASLRKEIDDSWIPWAKRAELVFWRGSSTGLRRFTPLPDQARNWDYLQRLQFVARAKTTTFRDFFDVGISKIVQIDEPHLINAIESSGLMRPWCNKLDFLKYRYIVDIDGNSNAWDGFFSAMLMGACILKVQSPVGWRQWYYDRLSPWEHYVPVLADLSNLEEAVHWALSHERECSEIGSRARALALGLDYSTELTLSSLNVAKLLLG